MKKSKPPIGILFVIYVLVILWLLFGQRLGRTHSDPYLTELQSMPFPFQTIIYFTRIILTGEPAHLVPHAWQNLIGNTVMFIPLGFFLPCFFKQCQTFRSISGIGLLIIACVECTQFFTLLGSLDFDDFMLNIIGILIGFVAWKKLNRIFPIGD